MKKLICRLFGHRWVTVDICDYYCSRCGKIIDTATLSAALARIIK